MTRPSQPPPLHRTFRFGHLIWTGLLVLLLEMLPGTTAQAGESTGSPSVPPAVKKRFDIPAGDAFTTLKRFTAQSGEQLIYKSDSLEGVQTVAVRGRFTPVEALGRMLLRTELAVTRDEKTGTLAIRPAAKPSSSSSASFSAQTEPAAKKKSPSP